MTDFSRRLKALTRWLRGGPRAAGPPRSPSGASSFHLVWRMPPAGSGGGGGAGGGGLRLVEVSAVLEILVPPTVPALYFWALQVDFVSGGHIVGGAHTGLQWNRRYPGGTAVNWGGYASPERGGGILEGSRSALPGFSDDPHTLAYRWLPGRAYRFRVFRSPEVAGAWRAAVTDLFAEETVVIRDLYADPRSRDAARFDPGVHFLTRPLVWSEVFAACDAPSVTVRWSDLSAVDEDGAEIRPRGVSVNYRSAAQGGCANTDVRTDGRGYLQITNTPRIARQDVTLPPLAPRAFSER